MNSTQILFSLLLTGLLFSGCEKKNEAPAPGPEAAPVVKPVEAHVIHPSTREVVDYEEFTGRILPFDEVDVRPQVTGTLLYCSFKEGARMRVDPQTGKLNAEKEPELKFREGDEVQEGELLFEIDSDVYLTTLHSAEGELQVLEARKRRLENEKKRADKLRPSGAISAEEYDAALFSLQECEAEIATTKAKIQKAALDVSYTKIYAPISGYLCKSEVSVGNLVQANSSSNSTTLVHIVKLDPIFININIDEQTAQLLKRLADERREKNPKANLDLEVEFRLSDEKEFTHKAKIDYVTPTLSQSTGTRLVRAVCENPKTASGERMFQPGMTVHARIRTTEKYQGVLIPEATLNMNQAIHFVYLWDPASGMPKIRNVELGPLQSDNMRVIRSGLSEEDQIVADNLLRVRLDRPVKPIENE